MQGGVDMQRPMKGSMVDSVVHDGLMLHLQDGSSAMQGSSQTGSSK